MKTFNKILICSTIISVAFFSCSKKSDTSPSGSSSSSWTIANTTYNSSTTVFTNNELLGIDQKISSDPDIGIQFNSRPVAGNYTLVNQYNATVGNNQCSILSSNTTGSPTYVSTNGGTVAVTVSNGKISASFKNIAVGTLSTTNNNGTFNFTSTGTCSGTLTEQ